MSTQKSDLARTLDELQAKLRPTLKEWGFRARGRGFNRTTSDDLTEVIQLQMGSFDPPGTTYIPGLRENRYGMFTVNLGVFVPEVAEQYGSGAPKSFIQEYHCCVRTRLPLLGPEHRDVWWEISARTGEGRARAKARGQSLGRPFKMTPHQRREALARVDQGEAVCEVARSFNVHPSTISRLCPSQP